MAATTIPKKNKLSPKEKREIAIAKKFLYIITHDWGEQTCKDYAPSCPACQHHLLKGMIRDWIATMEYGV